MILPAITPGEWFATNHFADDSMRCNCAYVLCEGYAGSVCVVSVDNGLNISDGGNDSPPRAEAAANAKAIAAVPRLLEAGAALIAKLDETLPATDRRPTIAELERILAAGNVGVVEIKQDGSIHVAPREEIEALRAALRLAGATLVAPDEVL